jgi:hypothetical protein
MGFASPFLTNEKLNVKGNVNLAAEFSALPCSEMVKNGNNALLATRLEHS